LSVITASRFLAGCEGSFMLAGSCIRYANLYSSASLIGVKEVGNLTANTGGNTMPQAFNPASLRLRQSTGKESIQQCVCVKLTKLAKQGEAVMCNKCQETMQPVTKKPDFAR